VADLDRANFDSRRAAAAGPQSAYERVRPEAEAVLRALEARSLDDLLSEARALRARRPRAEYQPLTQGLYPAHSIMPGQLRLLQLCKDTKPCERAISAAG
jgi:hypothetical protein